MMYSKVKNYFSDLKSSGAFIHTFFLGIFQYSRKQQKNIYKKTKTQAIFTVELVP